MNSMKSSVGTCKMPYISRLFPCNVSNPSREPSEPVSKLLVSPLVTLIVVPYKMSPIYPPLRSLDYSSCGAQSGVWAFGSFSRNSNLEVALAHVPPTFPQFTGLDRSPCS